MCESRAEKRKKEDRREMRAPEGWRGEQRKGEMTSKERRREEGRVGELKEGSFT